MKFKFIYLPPITHKLSNLIILSYVYYMYKNLYSTWSAETVNIEFAGSVVFFILTTYNFQELCRQTLLPEIKEMK